MADTDQVLNLAAIIREVDGNNRKGAAALAESILDHPRFRAALADGPAVPDGREPASVTGQPSDQEGPSAEDVEELCEEHCFNVEGYESIECLQGLINEAIARWGNPAPQPAAEGEVEELVRLLGSMAAEAELADQFHNASVLDWAADLLQRLSPPQPVPVSERLPVGVEQARAALAAAPESAVKQSLTTAPPAPLEGEVGEFIAQLKSYAEYGTPIRLIPFVVARAATLLEHLSAAAPAVVPVAVSERLPGAEDCDAEGRYWGLINGCEAWVLGKGSPSTLSITHWLPAHALPVPGQEVVE